MIITKLFQITNANCSIIFHMFNILDISTLRACFCLYATIFLIQIFCGNFIQFYDQFSMKEKEVLTWKDWLEKTCGKLQNNTSFNFMYMYSFKLFSICSILCSQKKPLIILILFLQKKRKCNSLKLFLLKIVDKFCWSWYI